MKRKTFDWIGWGLGCLAASAMVPAARGQSSATSPEAAQTATDDAAWSDAYGQIKPRELSHALRVIEMSTGGHVLEIRLLHRKAPAFEAVVAMGRDLVNVRVRALDDQVTRISVNETPRWMLDWRLRAEMRDVQHAKLSAADAIRRVEDSTQAPAIDAAIARPTTPTNRILAYDVEVLKGGQPRRVAIDAQTGEIIADPSSLLGDWTPERLAQHDEARAR